MAACHPRKFKDRIALLNQKQMEGQAQFQAVMQEVSEVWKNNSTPGLYKAQCHQTPQGGLGVPNHFQQSLHHPPHYSKYGGSLPNVNQLASSTPAPVRDPEPPVNTLNPLPGTLPGLHQFQQGLCQSLPGSVYSNEQLDQQRSGQFSPRGRAIRNRSGDQRFDAASPYRDQRHHSRSLSPYMSPTSKAPWRRISSDSALYQSVKAPPQNDLNSPGSDEGGTICSQEDATNSSGLYLVKEEVPCGGEAMTDPYHCKPPQSPNSPNASLLSPSQCYNTSSSYSIPIPSTISLPTLGKLDIQTYQQSSDKDISSQYQLNIEQDFLKFGLGNQFRETGGLQHKFGYSGGHVVMSHQLQDSTPSPNTPSGIPEFVITDFSENHKFDTSSISLKQQNNRQVGIFPFFEDPKVNQNGLDTDFSVDQLRQELEPIDEQMMAILTGTGIAEPDIQVEEHFKIN